MATNKDNNWIDINGGKFPATIGEDFFNYTPGQWVVGKGVNGGDKVEQFTFGDPYYSWQDSDIYGSFRDYVGIGNKNNMMYKMDRDDDGRSEKFNFEEWVNQHPEEYEEYRDENGTWYLDDYAKADLQGRAYAEWDKENKAERDSHSPEVKIKTGKKEGTVVNYRWDDSLNAFVPAEGHVEYWDTNNGFGHALKGMIGAVGTVVSTVLGGGIGGLAFNSAFNVVNGLTNGDSLWDSLKGGVPYVGSMIGGEGNTGWLGELMRTTFDAETPEGNLSGLVNQWKATRELDDEEKGRVNSFVDIVKNALGSSSDDQIKEYTTFAENLARTGKLTDENLQKLQDKINESNEAQKNYQLLAIADALKKAQAAQENTETLTTEDVMDTDPESPTEEAKKVNEIVSGVAGSALLASLLFGGGSLGNSSSSSAGVSGEVLEDGSGEAEGSEESSALGSVGSAISNLLGIGTGTANMANSFTNLLSSLAGIGSDGFSVYKNYTDKNKYKEIYDKTSQQTNSILEKNNALVDTLSDALTKATGDADKSYQALLDKIKVPSRNGDEWKTTPYYTTATQGSQNVNNAFAKALTAADTISQTWTDLGKAKMYGEDDVYDTYRKFANARTQLADRAAALTDSRTYAANRGNGVGTSTVQQEAQAENARKYMADLAEIDSKAYSDALTYVNNLSKLQTDQRNAAIKEAVDALNPTITTSTADATNQFKNTQNELNSLWNADKAADLERGWAAQAAQIGQSKIAPLVGALSGLQANSLRAAMEREGDYANAYGMAYNGLAQSINKSTSDLGSILSALGSGKNSSSGGSGSGSSGGVSGLIGSVTNMGSNLSKLLGGINFDAANAAADAWNSQVAKIALENDMTLEEAADWLMEAGGDPIKEIIDASESSSIFDGVSDFFGGIGDSISSGWDSITDTVSSGWDSLTNWIGSWF